MDFKHIPANLILYLTLYGGATMAALIACLYLCLCKGNAFKPDVSPPVRLRRWAVALFATMFCGHVLWLLCYIHFGANNSVNYVVIALLDFVTLLTTIPGTLLAMLQDRKRPVWPILLATIPLVALGVLYIIHPNSRFISIAVAYFMLVYLLFTLYMVFAIRQYGRWLRDNYADLENKEVWLSHLLIIVVFLLIIFYRFVDDNITISFIVQAVEIPLFGFLLWRIETLPQLGSVATEQPEQLEQKEQLEPKMQHTHQTVDIPSNIEQLLEEHCVRTKLYLQHELTLLQLAQAIGTNRFYLSQYFTQQGIHYNTYINNLRIDHFVNLYREATAAGKPFTAQQLADESGYRSYSTFSLAFKQRMGQNVTAWMHETAQ